MPDFFLFPFLLHFPVVSSLFQLLFCVSCFPVFSCSVYFLFSYFLVFFPVLPVFLFHAFLVFFSFFILFDLGLSLLLRFPFVVSSFCFVLLFFFIPLLPSPLISPLVVLSLLSLLLSTPFYSLSSPFFNSQFLHISTFVLLLGTSLRILLYIICNSLVISYGFLRLLNPRI